MSPRSRFLTQNVSIREFVDMMDATLLGTTVQEQLTVIKNAEWRLQEEKILDGQLKRWGTLVASEEEVLHSTELAYQCYKQQSLGQEDETKQLRINLEEVSKRIQQERREHTNTIRDLSETLTTLPHAPE
ncbi:hypothetical protein LXA43DRAFT_1065533 [Ganoderma leucocontextum]|nr:hypothetical protein LXA43DRAFT_1068127 [Ganoderma leucocontextum]KAI1785858.1 hypothetical protein LXA43DRAFT_1065533 [Ganoderma leucocontextum]